ncbi:unnamed protein product [Paramecium pentaurelia]|uniref:Importin N-terminal domain-containing protein n=1 Tax=Paramecium pentaurelia TaxID=43138 RepID=A0A8S1U8Q9_9CILI|nr:unnamed protein product [Paramecium pentaurelia]
MANILQVYEQCINNPEILRHGDQYLSEYLKNTPNFILESLKLIFDVNQQQRKYIAILFKNVILLNWQHLQQQIKSDILKVLVDGLQQEQQVPVQEIITIIITEVMRRDPEYQSLIPQFLHLYTLNPHIINTLIHIYQQLDGQNLISYCEIILQNMLSQQSPTSKTYNLVYQVIKMFSHCEQTDIEQLKQCFDSTFIQWMERFSQVLQQQDQLESQIYIMKALNLIFKEMKTYSKQIRKVILPQMTVFLVRLTNSIQYLEEINFLDECYEQEPNQEVLLFYTLQMLMELNNQQLCNTTIYSSLLQILSMPIKNISMDHFIMEDDPTVVQAVLMFFEQQLSNKKTYQNAKQLLLQYLQQQVEMVGQYVIISQFSSDLFNPNQNFAIIESILKQQSTNQNQVFQLQKLIALTNLYLLTKGQVEVFTQLFQLHVQQLKSQLGLVNLFNLGKLCAHASKNSTLDEQSFKCLVDQSNIQFPSIDQDTAHILFDSVLQMFKLCKTLQFPILQNIYHYWTTYPHDSLLGQIFYELLEILVTIDPVSVQQTFSTTNGLIWLKVNTIIAKYQPQLLINFIPQIAQQLLVFNEFTPQGIMLLKTLLQYNSIDQLTLNTVIQILDIQLNIQKEPELEALTEHVHDLLLVVWNKHMNRQITIQLLSKILQKIMHSEIPSTINGLTTILCAIYLQHSNQLLQWFQSNTDSTQQLFSKWLRFASILQQKSLLQLQINVIYQFTQLPYFDQLFYVDPFIDKVIPLKAKMMEFLISNQQQCKTIALDEDDEFQDIDSIETEFENDITECHNLIQPIQISFEHLQHLSKHLSKEQQQFLRKQ